MALTVQCPSPSTGTATRLPHSSLLSKPPAGVHTSFPLLGKTRALGISITMEKRNRYLAVKSREDNRESSQTQTESESVTEASGGGDSVTELGAEIKAAMEERKKAATEGGGDLLSGVAEEVREIEWPAFGKVLGTTGVVLGVIAGSSVVLLTVNFVLAELSDRVFAGKGVQDFFG